MGSLLLLFAGFGWAKPVPVNPYAVAKRNPLGMMWVSLAGPVSNFILALIAAVPLRLGVGDLGFAGNKFVPSLTQFLFEFIIINLSLMLFNLLPIAPPGWRKNCHRSVSARHFTRHGTNFALWFAHSDSGHFCGSYVKY